MTATDEPFELSTRRLTGGPIADALGGPGSPAQGLSHALLAELDGGEGWTFQEGDTVSWWFPGRFAVRLWCYEQDGLPAIVQLDAQVVHGAQPTEALLQTLSDLNAHAAGWWWWWHEGVVRCSLRCAADATNWWWPLALFDAAPIAVTVSESMADELARVSDGQVSYVEHPERGPRPSLDGWISGTRLGVRDPGAALGQALLPQEFARMRTALRLMTTEDAVVDLQREGLFVLADERGAVVSWRPHWHAQLGWGWQFTTCAAIRPRTDVGRFALYEMASRLNTQQAMNVEQVNCLGGWTVIPNVGLAQVTFVPALAAEQICAVAGPAIGDALAVMLELGRRLPELTTVAELDLPHDCDVLALDVVAATAALARMTLTTGVIGWSYLDPRGVSPDVEPGDHQWTDQVPLQYWTRPRQDVICTWGIFNPAGPTVGSLEVAWTAGAEGFICSLYHVLRHPFLPQVQLLGTVMPADLPQLIEECLSDPGPEILGSGPEWLDVFAYEDQVVAGLRSFAGSRPEQDWQETARRLTHFALYPWARLDSGQRPVESGADEAQLDVVDAWLEAIMNPVVVLGHRMFLRSAWEGAKTYRDSDWDPDKAQAAANFGRQSVDERYTAAFGS